MRVIVIIRKQKIAIILVIIRITMTMIIIWTTIAITIIILVSNGNNITGNDNTNITRTIIETTMIVAILIKHNQCGLTHFRPLGAVDSDSERVYDLSRYMRTTTTGKTNDQVCILWSSHTFHSKSYYCKRY